MSPENDDNLRTNFPRLYGAMWGGFDCDDGWFDLLFDLSVTIETVNNSLLEDDWIQAMQVKEKFGELRFYVNSAPEEIQHLISQAEERSTRICEVCGDPGNINATKRWLKTVCEEHKG